jgi:hypothetical protein
VVCNLESGTTPCCRRLPTSLLMSPASHEPTPRAAALRPAACGSSAKSRVAR